MINHTINEQKKEIIKNIAQKANDRLTDSSIERANQAFNLGCTIGSLPMLILLIGTFILSGGEWVLSAIVFVVLLIILLGMANLIAFISRKNVIKRIMESEILPQIMRELELSGIEIDDFLEYLKIQESKSILTRCINDRTRHE